MDYLDDQIRQRKEKDNELFEDSFIQLASAVVGKSSASRLSDDRIVTKEAVDEILKFFHYKPGEIPDNVTDDEDILEVLFRPFGIMRREITLEEGWHRQTCGPILAFLKEGERPVALLPKGLSGYVYKDRLTGEVIRVTKKNEKDLMEKALCFYRPMPMKSMKVRDLFSYMRECFELRDLFFVFLATAAVTVFGMLITQITKAMAGPVCNIGPGRDALFHQIRHAIGQHAGLAAARASQNNQRALCLFDGGALLGIQGIEINHSLSSFSAILPSTS